MQEWLNWPAWKASKRQKRFRGSNPLLSAGLLNATTDFFSRLFCVTLFQDGTTLRSQKTSLRRSHSFYRILRCSHVRGVAGRKDIYFQWSSGDGSAIQIPFFSQIMLTISNLQNRHPILHPCKVGCNYF